LWPSLEKVLEVLIGPPIRCHRFLHRDRHEGNVSVTGSMGDCIPGCDLPTWITVGMVSPITVIAGMCGWASRRDYGQGGHSVDGGDQG
jgi:hypothetical protein